MTLDTRLSLVPHAADSFHHVPEGDARARIFGGQLLAQAARAAMATIQDDRQAHSLHAHFLRPGDGARPIVFTVDRLRDGRTYSTRSVVAEQDGHVLLDARLSFQDGATGLSFADPMPDVPGPEGLMSEDAIRDAALEGSDVAWVAPLRMGGMGFELRPVFPRDFAAPRVMAPVQHFWIRPHQPVAADWRSQLVALTYVSDMMLLSTTLLPHGIYWTTTPMDNASLDHVIWYHALPRFDEWTLWSLQTPWSGSGRGLAQGRLYRRDGTLIASVAQEGLIRVRPENNG